YRPHVPSAAPSQRSAPQGSASRRPLPSDRRSPCTSPTPYGVPRHGPSQRSCPPQTETVTCLRPRWWTRWCSHSRTCWFLRFDPVGYSSRLFSAAVAHPNHVGRMWTQSVWVVGGDIVLRPIQPRPTFPLRHPPLRYLVRKHRHLPVTTTPRELRSRRTSAVVMRSKPDSALG